MIILDPIRRRRAAVLARSGCAVSALAFGIGLVGGLATDVAPAAAAEAGIAQIIEPFVVGSPSGGILTSGDGETDFSLSLPDEAACTGDTTNGGYNLYGYMIAGALNPNDLKFFSEGPDPTVFDPVAQLAVPLYTPEGSPYANGATDKAIDAGGPGPIGEIPSFDFAILSDPDVLLAAGDYNVGIACWRNAATGQTAVLDRYWNARITVAVDTTKAGAARVTWTAPVATTVELEAEPEDEAAEGATVELKATVLPDDAEGTVVFKDGDEVIDAAVTINANGVATLEVDDLDLGAHVLTAEFTPTAGSLFSPSVSSELDYTISEQGAATTSTSSASTTSTTGGGGSSTTSTTAGGGSSTTVTTAPSGGGPRTGTTGDLARTGFSFPIVVWGLLAIALGRMAMLLGRPTKVRP